MNRISTATKHYSIRAFGDLFGLTPATLRYYESLGLLKPQRAVNQRRYYTKMMLTGCVFCCILKILV